MSLIIQGKESTLDLTGEAIQRGLRSQALHVIFSDNILNVLGGLRRGEVLKQSWEIVLNTARHPDFDFDRPLPVGRLTPLQFAVQLGDVEGVKRFGFKDSPFAILTRDEIELIDRLEVWRKELTADLVASRNIKCGDTLEIDDAGEIKNAPNDLVATQFQPLISKVLAVRGKITSACKENLVLAQTTTTLALDLLKIAVERNVILGDKSKSHSRSMMLSQSLNPVIADFLIDHGVCYLYDNLLGSSPAKARQFEKLANRLHIVEEIVEQSEGSLVDALNSNPELERIYREATLLLTRSFSRLGSDTLSLVNRVGEDFVHYVISHADYLEPDLALKLLSSARDQNYDFAAGRDRFGYDYLYSYLRGAVTGFECSYSVRVIDFLVKVGINPHRINRVSVPFDQRPAHDMFPDEWCTSSEIVRGQICEIDEELEGVDDTAEREDLNFWRENRIAIAQIFERIPRVG